MHLALLFLLTTTATSDTCYTYTCSDVLSDSICVKLSDNYEIAMNGNGCPDSTPYCSLDDVKDWVGTAALNAQFPCSATNTTDYWDVPSDRNYLVCGSRYFKKDLASGSHPKLCESKLDCVLEDGTFNECECGLNGEKYCVPHLHSDVFDGYWSQCCSIGCGVLDTFEHYLFWTLKYTYYVDYISGYSCSKIFTELQDIMTLDYDYSEASLIVISLLAITLA